MRGKQRAVRSSAYARLAVARDQRARDLRLLEGRRGVDHGRDDGSSVARSLRFVHTGKLSTEFRRVRVNARVRVLRDTHVHTTAFESQHVHARGKSRGRRVVRRRLGVEIETNATADGRASVRSSLSLQTRVQTIRTNRIADRADVRRDARSEGRSASSEGAASVATRQSIGLGLETDVTLLSYVYLHRVCVCVCVRDFENLSETSYRPRD